MAESTPEIVDRNSDGNRSTERRNCVSCLPAKAALLSKIIRAHWSIENSMHWVMDVAFIEDDCRIRCDGAVQNFAVLRRISLSLLKTDTKTKLGVSNNRLKAGWDVSYLAKLLGLQMSKL